MHANRTRKTFQTQCSTVFLHAFAVKAGGPELLGEHYAAVRTALAAGAVLGHLSTCLPS